MSQESSPSSVVFVLGVTHHRASIEVREKLALRPEAEEALRDRLSGLEGLREFAILNTCNRVEFYGVATAPRAIEAVRDAYCERQCIDRKEFGIFCLELRDRFAVQHLFEVASGLDSQMVGETEIFGQVKEAYAWAQSRGSTGVVLNRAFQKAFQAAKQVRTDTAISLGQVSVANVAVELAFDIFGSLKETRILLVGAGEIGEKTARAFQSRGASAIAVCSRRMERAMELAVGLGASALPFEQREHRLADFDIVVCATSAPGAVISAAAGQAAIRRRPARALLFIDLALPRDVEPGVAECENVYLYNLDDLARVAEENRRSREAHIASAKAILEEKAAKTWQNLSDRLRISD
ncbi:MAG: glutamyl-tRNA reductase [Opitutaceae bacterium]|jgi:glutamyl-tRNA reductase